MDNSNEAPMRHGRESESIDLLSTLHIVRSAGGALCSQASLYGKLARIAWLEEKNRLRKMLLMALLGSACTLCLMLFISLLVLAFSWQTGYRIPAVISLLLLYGTGIGIAWYHLNALTAVGNDSFVALREEFSIDAALIRSRL